MAEKARSGCEFLVSDFAVKSPRIFDCASCALLAFLVLNRGVCGASRFDHLHETGKHCSLALSFVSALWRVATAVSRLGLGYSYLARCQASAVSLLGLCCFLGLCCGSSLVALFSTF